MQRKGQQMTFGWVFVYVAAFATFLVIDLIWLGLVAKGFYRTQMGTLLAENPNWPIAFLFYALFIFGVLYFAVAPAAASDSWTIALRNGALFGLLTYATYDLTSLAVLRNFPATVAWVDIVWGTVLTTSVTAVAFRVWRALAG